MLLTNPVRRSRRLRMVGPLPGQSHEYPAIALRLWTFCREELLRHLVPKPGREGKSLKQALLVVTFRLRSQPGFRFRAVNEPLRRHLEMFLHSLVLLGGHVIPGSAQCVRRFGQDESHPNSENRGLSAWLLLERLLVEDQHQAWRS